MPIPIRFQRQGEHYGRAATRIAPPSTSSSFLSFPVKRQRAPAHRRRQSRTIPSEFDSPLRPPGVAAPGTTMTCRLVTEDNRHVRPENVGGMAFDPSVPESAGALFLSTRYGIFRMSRETGVMTLLAGSWDEQGYIDAIGPAARFAFLRGIVPSHDGRFIFACDRNSHCVRRLDTATGLVTTFATLTRPGNPCGITISPDGSRLFVTDQGQHMIWCIDVATAAMTAVAGAGAEGSTDGVGAAASFNSPCGIVVSPDGASLFVADLGNLTVRCVDLATRFVTTLAGSPGEKGCADGAGPAADFNSPCGIVISPDGTELFLADYQNNKVRSVDVATGTVKTVAGSGARGNTDGVGETADLFGPFAIAISLDGAELLVTSHDVLRAVAVEPPPVVLPALVVPPSTFMADIARTFGDGSLPQGAVTFVVGTSTERIEHVTKANLCVRSEYFSRMFRSGMAEAAREVEDKEQGESERTRSRSGSGRGRETEIMVPDATPAAFKTMLQYLLSDAVAVDPTRDMQHAYDVIKLADKYGMPRLGLLVTEAMANAVCSETVVPFLEAAQTMGDERLFAQCRAWIATRPEAVASAGVDQLMDLGLAKGLLRDAMEENRRLKAKCGETNKMKCRTGQTTQRRYCVVSSSSSAAGAPARNRVVRAAGRRRRRNAATVVGISGEWEHVGHGELRDEEEGDRHDSMQTL